MKKKILVPVIGIGLVAGITSGVYFGTSSDKNSSVTSTPDNAITISKPISNKKDDIDNSVKVESLSAPKLVKANSVDVDIETVTLTIGINEKESIVRNNKVIKNIVELASAGFLKEAKAEAERSLERSTGHKKVTIEVIKSMIKTQ